MEQLLDHLRIARAARHPIIHTVLAAHGFLPRGESLEGWRLHPLEILPLIPGIASVQVAVLARPPRRVEELIMVKSARAESLRFALEHHLEETQEQVERLKDAFGLVGTPAKGKPCRGMEGLIAEGEEVMEAGQDLENAAAD